MKLDFSNEAPVWVAALVQAAKLGQGYEEGMTETKSGPSAFDQLQDVVRAVITNHTDSSKPSCDCGNPLCSLTLAREGRWQELAELLLVANHMQAFLMATMKITDPKVLLSCTGCLMDMIEAVSAQPSQTAHAE